jgi:hypothetical protein
MGIAAYVFGNLFWALVGALLGVSIPSLLLWAKYKQRPDILGDWKSSYQGIDEPEGTWVTEDISIRVKGSKLLLKNSKSSHQYNYSAFGSVTGKIHLIGDWESIRPGANAYGAFILTISAQGDSMYGYWVGTDRGGARRYGRWVLARSVSDIDGAKNLLECMRHSRLPP